jgi:trk system potassium uptake protein TrkA
VRDVYAKAASDAEARALDALGVTDAILADHDAGVRLAHRISSRGCLEYVPIAEGVSLQEMPVPATWIGKSLRALAPRGELGVQVIAVRDALTESLAVPPDPDAVLKDSDALVVVGSDEVLVTLQRRR